MISIGTYKTEKMNIDETNFLLCDLPCVFSPLFQFILFFSPLRAYMYTFTSTCIRTQVELVNVYKFVYIKTCIVHNTSSSKTTGTFMVNIAEISLTFSLSLSLTLSFSSLCNIFVECYVAC